MEENSVDEDLPARCQECAKSVRTFIHEGCSTCQKVSFEEDVLCYLNRSVQDPDSFECHAFQSGPRLSIVSRRGGRPESKDQPAEAALDETLNSDKLKYRRALALQKLARDPDALMIYVQYHLAWNVAGRRPAFSEPATMLDFVIDTIAGCSDVVGGVAYLLWLAPDHIHVHVESDGEVSPDSMAKEIKRLSEAAILERFPDLVASSEAGQRLWDEAYFVETIG